MANILVVDDDEADRLLLKTVLESKGHNVEDLSATHTIHKPIDPQKLLTAVAKALDAREEDFWGQGRQP